MSDEQDRRSELDEAYAQAWPAWGHWQNHAKDDLYTVADNAWTKADIAHMKKVNAGREIMSFPLLRRFVRLIGNFERNNRTSIRYEPVEASDDQAAAQYTTLANDALARSGGYHVKSDCFDHALKTGLSLFNLALDRDWGFHFEKFGYNQFLLHPAFSKRDLSDCQYGILRKYLTVAEAAMLFDVPESELKSLLRHGEQDEKFQNMPNITIYGEHMLVLDEFQRRGVKTVRTLVDVQEGGPVLDAFGNPVEAPEDEEQLSAILAEHPYLDVVSKPARTVLVTHYLNGREVYHGVDPFGIGDFSFTPYFAYFDPEIEHFHLRIQSVIRGLKDSQRAFDRRTIANIRALECVIGSGLDVEENALVDDEQAYTAGAGHPRFWREGAIAEGRFRDRPAPNLPAGWLEMQDVFDKLPGKILNLNEDGLLGIDQKDQLLLGVVGKMRLGLGMVGMFDFFDNKAYSDRVMGIKLLKLLQQLPPQRAIRVLNEPLARSFYNRQADRFDAVSAETILTDTQRNAAYTELLNLKIKGAEIGDPFPISWSQLLQMAPTALKHQVLQQLAAVEQQQRQAQEQAAKVQQALQEATLANLNVNTANEQVHVAERAANLVETKVDTAQTIQEMQTQPNLELLDRMIEFEKIAAMKQSRQETSNGNSSKNR